MAWICNTLMVCMSLAEATFESLMNGSVLGNTAWYFLCPLPLNHEAVRVPRAKLYPVSCFPSDCHLTSVETLLLTVRLSASEARNDRALILELMLGWGPAGLPGEQRSKRSKFLRKLRPTKP